nr:TetR/AcrR family transcriptional regulator [Kordiimonas marina]
MTTADDTRPTRGRPRDAEKNSAILEAAGELFLVNGYDGTSMDEVAKRAGVSKQTVYSHFSSKEQLFSEAIHQKIEAYFPDSALSRVTTHTLEADLRAVSEAYMRLALSPEAIAVNRTLMTAAAKNTNLPKIFWEAGPQDLMVKLSAFLKGWVERGALKIEDIDEASDLLMSLLKGRHQFPLSIGLIDHVSDAEIDAHVDQTIRHFLKLYSA